MEKFLVPFSIILAGLIVAGSILVTGEKITFPQVLGFSLPFIKNNQPLDSSKKETEKVVEATPQPKQPPLPQSLKDGDLGTNPILGNSTAKVAISVFSDYQCPFCGQFVFDVMPKLRSDYIDKGLVKFVVRDLAFLGPESKDAALATKCASVQGKYWEYHDYLFKYIGDKEKQNPRVSQENNGNFSAANLKKFAKTLGLNTSKFNTCFDGRTFDVDVKADVDSARNYAVFSTPTVYVNGKFYDNRYGYDGLYPLIDSLIR